MGQSEWVSGFSLASSRHLGGSHCIPDMSVPGRSGTLAPPRAQVWMANFEACSILGYTEMAEALTSKQGGWRGC